MRFAPARQDGWTRRTLVSAGMSAFLNAGLGPESRKGAVLPAAWRRYPDPATELEVLRLTDPEYASLLPACYNRSLARRNSFLIYSSDRDGAPQAYRLDLKSGESRQLTDAAALDPSSVCLLPGDRSLCYFDGPSLRLVSLSNLREREVYRVPEGWSRCDGANVTVDGQRALFGERQGEASRLRAVTLGRGAASTLVQMPWPLAHPIGNPRRAQVLYRQSDEALWVASLDGKQNRRLRLAEGATGPARWSPDGNQVIYLNFPSDPGQLNALREYIPDENSDKLLARTSQFVHFGANGDASVFVGASRNKAAPHVLILLRVTRRELTLCEHRASDPGLVAPMFSPDSQRVYFQSDRHGKPAIYCMRIEKFVEMTEDDDKVSSEI
jgi:oligogalacturonide lyase